MTDVKSPQISRILTTILLCLTWLLMIWALWLFYNKHVIVSVVKVSKVIRGPPSNHQGGGGGVFVADKLFISTKLGGALKISNFIICLYRTVLGITYLFHWVYPKLYIKKTTAPTPCRLDGCPVDTFSRPKIYKISCIFKSHYMHPFSTPSLPLQNIVYRGLCVNRGYLWSCQANNATLKQCDYSRIHINCGEWFLSISQLIPNQLSWYMYRHYFLVMVRLPWKCHWKILHSLKAGLFNV